jgi:FMN reductase
LVTALKGLDNDPDLAHQLIDLGRYRLSFADGRKLDEYDDDTAQIVQAVTSADAVILASPVYRATYTGALKNLLDLLPVDALRGKPIGIVAMGATLHHHLGVDWQLRAVLAWFGAVAAPTSVYLTSQDFDGDCVKQSAITPLEELLQTVLKMAALVGTARSPGPLSALGPQPIAAHHA